MTYGVEIKEENDPWIKLAEDVVMTLRACIQPGAFLVDLIPACKCYFRSHFRELTFGFSEVRAGMDARRRFQDQSTPMEDVCECTST